MTGRVTMDRFQPVLPYDNPKVKIGISLATPHALHLSSIDSFYVTVRARILATTQPRKPITIMAHRTLFSSLTTAQYPNIMCIAPPASAEQGKHIEIWPRGEPSYRFDPNDLSALHDFYEIPINGILEVKLPLRMGGSRDVPQLYPGERYRITVVDRLSRCHWFAFKSWEELQGVRLRQWWPEEEDPNPRENLLRVPYREGPTDKGEDPMDLAFIPEEQCEAEFEIAP